MRVSASRRSLLPVVIALSIMLASCTTDGSSRPPTTTAASAAAPPPPAELCGGPTTPAQSLWLSGPGGAQIYAAVVGTGPATAVFVQQAGPTGAVRLLALCRLAGQDQRGALGAVQPVRHRRLPMPSRQCGRPVAGPRPRPRSPGPAPTAPARSPWWAPRPVASWPCRSRPRSARRWLPWWICRGSGAGWGWTRWRLPGACRSRRCSPSHRVTAMSAWARCGSCIEAAPVRAKRLVVLAEGAGHGWELLGGAAG